MSREFDLVNEIVLPVTPEEVWAAVATPEGQAAWFMSGQAVEPSDAEVWDPPKRLVIRAPEGEDGSFDAYEYLIEGREGSTVLRFVHSGLIVGDQWPDEFEDMTRMGWGAYLHSLREYLVHFPGRPAVYVEAEGPERSATWPGWEHFITSLGPTEVGDEVSLTVPGLPEQEGVVDIVMPGFVGIRTGDSLLRFHCRVPFGMTAAVSHHVYSPIDVDAYAAAWKAWLGSAFG
ncbi:SRPBCC domain-containing protein [Allokutzneria multivorans]|uniref:SRPBCC domain-containing protein n=1 Tax=Allokutzneria multivorans TaxID=1142134 RepID=A0ABP7SQV3_9PSEU